MSQDETQAGSGLSDGLDRDTRPEPTTASEVVERLMEFYEADTAFELIFAQQKSIHRLQEKLRAYQPSNEQFIGRKSREG